MPQWRFRRGPAEEPQIPADSVAARDPDLAELVERARAMEQQVEAIKSDLAATWLTGIGGGGAVSITMTALGDVRSVSIDPKLVAANETVRLEEFVLAAVRDVSVQLRETAERRIGEVGSSL